MNEQNEIAWREWSDQAFADAKAQDKPVLLDIGAVWCHWCHVMDTGIPGDPVHTGTYSDPEVQQRIAANFIPIKVDNDRRPDINARYNMGGWPTTAFLTPDGSTLYGETYVPPPRMVALLDYITDIYHNQKDQIAQTVAQRMEPALSPPSELDPQTSANVIQSIKRSFDPVYGGFGNAPKFPHPDSLLLVLEQYALTHDPELRVIAEQTLHGMADGGMYDQFAGGFFRYSTTRDWSIPHYEKMLEDNSKLTSVYALASVVLEDEYYLNVVKSAHDWMLSEMRDAETGMFAGSQDADKEEAYYGQPLAVRATLPTPYIDRTIYAGWNALMASSLVARYRITGESDIINAALKTCNFFEREMSALKDSQLLSLVGRDEDSSLVEYTILYHFYLYGKGQGNAGLLTDQVELISACLDIYEVTGSLYYLYISMEAGDYILDFLEDKENGGFFDAPILPGAIGELASPKQEIGDNATAAIVLIRLHGFVEDCPQYRQAAERALQSFAGEYTKYSYFASSYARAVDAAFSPGLHITIVGAVDDPNTCDLQQAAWRIVSPGKTIETLDAKRAAERQLPADHNGLPYASICIGTVCLPPVTDPKEIASQIDHALQQ